MKLLNEYFEKQQEVYDYFGYVEDWAAFPLDDKIKFYWYINGNEVVYSEKKEDLPLTDEASDRGHYYSDEINCGRFLPKSVYEKPDYTMITVDTHVDGNKFLYVFDNSKKVK